MNNNDLDLLKSSIREYINIIIATTMPYVEKHNLNKDFSGIISKLKSFTKYRLYVS